MMIWISLIMIATHSAMSVYLWRKKKPRDVFLYVQVTVAVGWLVLLIAQIVRGDLT